MRRLIVLAALFLVANLVLRPASAGFFKIPDSWRPKVPDVPKKPEDVWKILKDATGISAAERQLSEAAYFTYKKHVTDKNRGTSVTKLRRGTSRFDQLAKVFNKKVKIEDVNFYFDAYVPADMAAVTFGEDVYVRGPDGASNGVTVLLGHEIVHVMQYARLGGEKDFAHRYFGQIAKSARDRVLRGNFDVGAMHDDLELESEAHEYEHTIEYVIKNGRLPPDALDTEDLTVDQLKRFVEQLERAKLGKALVIMSRATLKHAVEEVDRQTRKNIIAVLTDEPGFPTLKLVLRLINTPTLKDAMESASREHVKICVETADRETLKRILENVDRATLKAIVEVIDSATYRAGLEVVDARTGKNMMMYRR